MPPTFTTKNIFDAVFAQLPADAFLDTGPASLREELMLESAGLRGGAGGSASDGRGGSSHFRRQLLPASALAAAAGQTPIRPSTAPTRSTDTATAALVEGEEDVLKEGAAGVNPPAHAYPRGLISQVQEEVPAFRRTPRVVRGKASTTATASEKSDAVSSSTGDAPGDFAIDLDTEDDAVKEAMKYAGRRSGAHPEVNEEEEERKDEGHGGFGDTDGDLMADLVEPSAPSAPPVPPPLTPASLQATESHAVGGGKAEGIGEGHARSPTAGGSVVSATAEGQLTHAPQASLDALEGRATSTATELAASTNASVSPGASQQNRSAGGGGGAITAAEQLIFMPPGLDRVYTGHCVMCRHPRGFGFLSPDLGGPDVYFINDGISLSFTRLALRAFYLTHGLPVPTSVANAVRGCVQGNVMEGAETLLCAQAAVAAEEDVGTSIAATSAEEGHLSASAVEDISRQPSNAGPNESSSSAEVNMSEGILGDGTQLAMSAGTPLELADRVTLPPTTAAETAMAEKAAALLSPVTARLLQLQVDQGLGGGIRVGDQLSFVVTRNHAGRGGNGRLLRAEFLRGLPSAHYAMPVEQSWFAALFPGAVGWKGGPPGAQVRGDDGGAMAGESETAAMAHGTEQQPGKLTTAEDEGTLERHSGDRGGGVPLLLSRYTGCVRTYDAEDQRGYIRCDDGEHSGGNTIPDVLFNTHAILWDLANCPPIQRQVKENMRVAYSVCAVERNGKYVATLITNAEGQPLSKANMTFAEPVRPFFTHDGGGGGGRRRGREEGTGSRNTGTSGGNNGGGANGGGGGDGMSGSGGAEMAGTDRKRAKIEEELLLLEEDDYPYI